MIQPQLVPHEVLAEAVSWRHDLHRHPEIAFQERRTSDFVASQLQRFGLTVHRGLAGTGVVGTLRRGTSRRSIGIRADMDALPIQEQGLIEHASIIPGAMHACGHDGHVVGALTAARVCARLENLDGTVHFIFQPAEEAEGGARKMVEGGLFQQFPCDRIFAFHNWPTLPLGSCVARDGAMMAALATFEIVVGGRGAHGAMPHYSHDPVVAASHVICALQSLVSRNVDPLQSAVVSVTQVKGGGTWNVVPDECVIRGTTRWFDEAIGETVERRLVKIAQGVSAGLGCEAKVNYERRFVATINDVQNAGLIRSLASEVGLQVLDPGPSMASEDFAFMLRAVPGCYIWLGSSSGPDGPGLHASMYDFNDQLLPVVVGLWVALVKSQLTR